MSFGDLTSDMVTLVKADKLRDRFAAEHARAERDAAAEKKEAEHFESEDAKARYKQRSIRT